MTKMNTVVQIKVKKNAAVSKVWLKKKNKRYQSEKAEHCQTVVWAAGPAAVQLVQAIDQDSVHQLTTGLHTGQQHTNTLIPCCENCLRELNLLRRGHTGQNPVQHLRKKQKKDSGTVKNGYGS